MLHHLLRHEVLDEPAQVFVVRRGGPYPRMRRRLGRIDVDELKGPQVSPLVLFGVTVGKAERARLDVV